MAQKFIGASLGASVLLGTAFLSSPVLAQDPEADTEMEIMIVTASRTEQTLMDVTRSVAVLDEDTIKEQISNDVAELLRDIPGVSVLEGATPGLRRISIRGEGQSRNTILIDGQEVSDHSTYGSLFMIDPVHVERIEVVKGPSSVLHGSKAIGGVVNIITKKAPDTPLELSVGGGYDSSTHGYNANASIAGFEGDWYYRIATTKSDHDDRETPDGKLEATAITNGSKYDNQSLSASVGYSSGNHEIRFTADRFEMNSNAYIDPATLSPPGFPGISKFILDLPQRDRTKFGLFYDGTDLTQSIRKVHFDLYAQRIDRTVDIEYLQAIPDFRRFPIGTATDLSNETIDKQQAIGVNGQIDMTLLEDHLTIAGFQFVKDSVDRNDRRNGTKTDVVFTPPTMRYMPLPFPPPRVINDDFDKEASVTTYSAFVQDEWDVTPDLAVTGGVRYFHMESELSKTNQPGYAPFDSSDDEVIGSLGVNYTGIDNVALRANVAQGYVYPTLLQNTLGSVFSPGEVIEANKDLEAEQSLNYEIGARFDNGTVVIETAAFHSFAEDYIDTVFCGTPSVSCNVGASSKYVNIDEATTYGVELTGSYTFAAWDLTPYLSATYMVREFDNAGVETNNTDIPAFTGQLGVRKLWGGHERMDLTTDLFTRAASDRENGEPSDRGYEKFSGFATLNLAASMVYQLDDDRDLRLNASVENILDKSYTEPLTSSKAAGRTFRISTQLTF